jgi:hypothetical protein
MNKLVNNIANRLRLIVVKDAIRRDTAVPFPYSWVVPFPYTLRYRGSHKDGGGKKTVLSSFFCLNLYLHNPRTAVMRYTHLSFNPRRDTALPCPYRVSSQRELLYIITKALRH